MGESTSEKARSVSVNSADPSLGRRAVGDKFIDSISVHSEEILVQNQHAIGVQRSIRKKLTII